MNFCPAKRPRAAPGEWKVSYGFATFCAGRPTVPRAGRADYHLGTQESTYSIHVSSDENTSLKALAEAVGNRMVAVITDETVDALHTERISQWLSGHVSKVLKIVLPSGESSKSLPVACHLLDWLAQSDMRRRDVIVAVGGGAIIDTAGWVASIYMRGISYINVPTTLLAQVDAAIGGKVAVNHDIAKNLIGSFYAPDVVGRAPTGSAHLDSRQFRSGLAEAIKMAVISSRQLLAFIEQHLESLAALDPPACITGACCVRDQMHAGGAGPIRGRPSPNAQLRAYGRPCRRNGDRLRPRAARRGRRLWHDGRDPGGTCSRCARALGCIADRHDLAIRGPAGRPRRPSRCARGGGCHPGP